VEDLLTPQEVATLKGVAKTTVYNAIEDGRLPARKILKRVGIRQADADAWEPVSHGGKREGSGKKPAAV
jgi:excisionase family DNA binding protein